MTHRVVVVGAGVAGLVAALELAVRGIDVTLVERAPTPGGKLRELAVGNARIDGGPTVFTMRWIFEEIFARAGTSLAAHLTLQPAEVLARHAWSAQERLDLYADVDRTADAIGAFSGPDEARRYRSFCERARRIYATLDKSFIRAPAPSPVALIRNGGFRGLGDLWRIKPFDTLWSALGDQFRDPRLRQLFGRYATYCGSSPFLAPATLMLIAHVEREGVWLVQGGMFRLALALANVAAACGARLRFATAASEIVVSGGRACGVRLASGESIAADAVVINADVAAIASGRLGARAASAVPPSPRSARSLSAITWAMVAPSAGFALQRHNVFFSADYGAEFDDLQRRLRLPTAPTVYVCAQDRDGVHVPAPGTPERLFCLINAPPNGDSHRYTASEIAQCEQSTFDLLARCGLNIDRHPATTTVTMPQDFERLFPGTGGALYGSATHGWKASFSRPGSRSRIPGLYLAGGSTHPGPGVPMAALSGSMAANALLADLASTRRSHPMAMHGGMSTR